MPQGESVSASLIRRSELPVEGIVALQVLIGGEMEYIIVHCRDGQLRAFINSCPHQGRRLDYAPGKFLLDGERLVCAAHGASFRLDDGLCVGGPCRGEHLAPVAIEENALGELVFNTPRTSG